MPMIKAVIFDMDGVLVDSERYWKQSEREITSRLAPAWDPERSKELMGMNITQMFYFLDSELDPDVTRDEFTGMFNRLADSIYLEKVSMPPGCMELIEGLRKEGIRMAVASSSPLNWIEMVVERFGLTQFEALVSAEHVGHRGKPNPDIFLYAARQLGLEPGECLVIEDSENGVAAAGRAGMKCVALKNSSNEGHDLSGADMVIKGFDELSPGRVMSL
jgi:HAD superfamily hydrolase (TIGR01509 family)